MRTARFLACLAAGAFAATGRVARGARCNLDVDGDGRVEVATDVVYIARHLSGLTPVPPSFRQNHPDIPDDATIRARVEILRPQLDVDGNGRVEVATDVVYMARHLSRLTPVPPSFRTGHPEIPTDAIIAAAVDACVPAPTTTTTTSTSTTTIPISFAAQIQPIFTANCAFPGCHAEPSPQQGLVLSAGQARASLVKQPSAECGAFERVAPRAPESSYIVFKLRGTGPCFVGAQMPKGGAPLSAVDQAKIVRWITEGAM